MLNEMMNSQPKVRLSKVLLMLCLSAAIVMGTMPCAPFVMEVKADTPAEKTITGLGLGTIMTKPNEPEERFESWSGSHVYFGKYAGKPMKYRVLACSENMILLDCDNILKDIQFSTNNNSWKESEVRSWLQGNDFYNNTDVFTVAEKNAIHAGNEEIEGINDGIIDDYSIAALEDSDPVFVLNVSAVTNSRLGYYNDTDWSNTREKHFFDDTASKRVDWWWLRSKGKDQIDHYDSVGTVYNTKVHALSVIDEWVGVSPALYLDTAPILYSSLVNGSEGQAGSEYKLTVKEEGLSVSYNNVEGEDDTISVSYTFEDNSESADPTQISVVVTDKAWDSETKLNEINVIQYTKLAMDSFGSSGTGTFTLDPNPTGTWGKDYHVYILAEDVNGGHETDYASPPVEIGRDSSAVWASAKNQEFTYDGNPHGITVNVTHPTSGVTVKYGESTDNCTLDTCPTITNVSESPKTIYYKAEAGGFTTAAGFATVTINKADPVITAPSAKTGLKYTGKAQALIDAGTVTGGTMYYAVTTGTAAPDGSAYTETVPQKTDAGTYYVWYKVTAGDGNHKDVAPDSVSVTINRAESAITKAPSAKTGLKYTGQAQALVNEGIVTGGTIDYAVTTENKAPAGSAYTETVPQKTDAGTYYVWYKVNGGGNYEDIDPSSVTVTIAEEDKPDEPERKAERPVLIKATSDAISVEVEEGVEYSIDEGNNWKKTGIFTGLQSDTEYSVIARYAAGGGKEAGKPSEALTVRTLKIVETPVSTKTLKVSDNEIQVDTVLSSEENTGGEGYSVGQVEIPEDVALSLFNNLTEEEQKRVAGGAKLTITVSVKESVIGMEDEGIKNNKKNADEKIKEISGRTVEATGVMLDMGLFVQVGNDERKETEPSKGSGKITFTVTVPVDMKNTDDSITRTFYLIHILDDGTVEIVNSGTEAEIPAETDSFSYWYLTYVDEKKESGKEEEEEKKDDNTGNNGNTSTEKVITVSDNQPMAYSEETKGEFRIGYCHEIPFFGKAKPELKLFGDIKVIYDGKEYKATKIKVNKKKGLIRIIGLDNADKDTVKAVKKATKGSNGLSFKVNPYYVKDTDTVTPKFKKDGSLKSVKVRIQGKDYKAKKGEFSYDQVTKTVVFDGDNLKGSCRLP